MGGMGRAAPIKHLGNETLFLAVEMSLVSTLSGIPLHVHAEGLRGTGKTTVMRWVKNVMPEISRIPDCPYYCDPDNPRCPEHRDGGDKRSEMVLMPFVELGHGAKLGTILGSVDLGKLTASGKPQAALLPGSIPMANRGIIFIDEVNRLAETAPEITDVLLSVMGTKPGLVKIEEVGLPPCEIEVASSVWAASNPDEDPGPLEDIRRQLADRFDLVVPVQRPTDPAIVERLLFGGESSTGEAACFLGLAEKALRLPEVTVPKDVVRYISDLYVRRNVESLRAVEALELSSRLLSAIRGKGSVSFDEMLVVLPLVLRHRLEPSALSEILRDLELRKVAGAQVKPPPPGASPPPAASPPPDRRPSVQDAASPSSQDAAAGPSLPDVTGPSSQNTAGPPIQDILTRSRAKDAAHGRDYRPAMPADAGEPRAVPKTNWFERLVDRYRKAAGERRGGSSSVAGSRVATDSRVQRLPDPATLKPVSPPNKARPVTSISWSDLVTPPDWRDRIP